MTGYDRKRVRLWQDGGTAPVVVRLEADVRGDGRWRTYRSFTVPLGGETVEHVFPEAYSAYWVRAVAERDLVATVEFVYE
jgi:hypothetical protein